MPQFYLNSINIDNDIAKISEKSDIKHILNVLRLKENDEILLIDEHEIVYQTRILEISPTLITTKVIDKHASNKKLSVQVDLAQSLLKSTAQDLVVQKMTELGVRNFFTMPAKRSVAKLTGKDILSKISKWKRIVEESCKQCERADKMAVHFLPSFEELACLAKDYDVCLACVERSSDNSIKTAMQKYPKARRVLVIIGPEGGFEDIETEFFKQAGMERVSLSNLIYRAETASIAAIASVIYEYEL
ncbi:MAG: RsmE family RNA methyltransferase [Candidatus Gastranaerophilales bacterium]|nr:RsmE family RNA methyltransferase [Candidatus Gastranaerophilales bacterium]